MTGITLIESTGRRHLATSLSRTYPPINNLPLRRLHRPSLAPFGHHLEPQKSHREKRQRKQQQVPSPVARRRGFHLRSRFTPAIGARQDQPHFPHFVAVE